MAPSGIAFDAFGTLFDLQGLAAPARDAVGDRGDELVDALLSRLVPSTWHATAAGSYRPITEIAALALLSGARETGLDLDRKAADDIASGLASLPAFSDAAPALRSLAGTPRAVLSNGTRDGLRSLLRGAGLERHFEHLLAADEVGRFKPAPEVYALAPSAFGADAGQTLLVSSNEWDVAGGQMAGLRGAFVARGRPVTAFLGVEPDLVVDELEELPAAVERL